MRAALKDNAGIMLFNVERVTLFFLLFSASAYAGFSPASAEDWTSNQGRVLPPTSAENRIVKWCEKDGDKVRYASANLEIKGFAPCGTVATAANCDATGNRYIGPATGAPHGYLDCNNGQRIYIERDGKELALSSPSAKESKARPDKLEQDFQRLDALLDDNPSANGEPVTPLTASEKKELQKKLAQLASRQRQPNQVFGSLGELDKMLMPLFKSLETSGKLDPKLDAEIKKLLGGQDLKALLEKH